MASPSGAMWQIIRMRRAGRRTAATSFSVVWAHASSCSGGRARAWAIWSRMSSTRWARAGRLVDAEGEVRHDPQVQALDQRLAQKGLGVRQGAPGPGRILGPQRVLDIDPRVVQVGAHVHADHRDQRSAKRGSVSR